MINVKKDSFFDVKTQLPYMKDTVVNSHLTAQEQAEHIKLYRETQDEKHRDIVIETNMLFVASVARKFVNHKLNLSDLMSSGMLGLLKAFDKFELDRNINFISYARHWVEHYIRRDVSYNTNIVRIPTHSYRLLKKVRKLVEEGKSSTDIQNELNLSRSKVSLLRIAGREVSMDQMLTDDDFKISDTIGEDDAAAKEIELGEELSYLLEKVKLLEPREKDILQRRFGLDGYESQTLDEVSKVYAISRERVRQIENKAIKTLRKMCSQEFYI